MIRKLLAMSLGLALCVGYVGLSTGCEKGASSDTAEGEAGTRPPRDKRPSPGPGGGDPKAGGDDSAAAGDSDAGSDG